MIGWLFSVLIIVALWSFIGPWVIAVAAVPLIIGFAVTLIEGSKRDAYVNISPLQRAKLKEKDRIERDQWKRGNWAIAMVISGVLIIIWASMFLGILIPIS